MRGVGAGLLAALVAMLAALLLTGPAPTSATAGYGVAGSRFQQALVSRYGAVASASPDPSAARISALADRGLRLTPFQIEVLAAEKERLNAYAEARRLYLDNGAVPAAYPIGHERSQADLARTLRTLAVQGPEAFYRGPIAEAIVAEM